jgi:hypothetical protein
MSSSTSPFIVSNATDDEPSTKKEGSSYMMVIIYAVLIVLLIILLLYSFSSEEGFLGKNTRDDPQGDWDLLVKLKSLDQLQEELLHSSVRNRNREFG